MHEAPQERARRNPLALRAVSIGALVSVLVLMAWALAPLFLGWKPLVITSGSMSPAVKPGDVVVIQPTSEHIHVGSVITFRSPTTHKVVTHRVSSINVDGSYVTKGDANSQHDAESVRVQDVRGQVRLLVPMVGKLSMLSDATSLVAAAVVGLGGLALIATAFGGTGSIDLAPRRTKLLTTAMPVVIMATSLGTGAVLQHSKAAWSSTNTNSNSAASKTSFYADTVIAAAPMSYWRLGETSGTTGADAVGSRPVTFGAGVATGKTGALVRDTNRAVQVDGGTTDYIQALGTSSSLSIAGNISVEAWVKPTASTNVSNSRIVAKYDGTNVNYILGFDSAGTAMRFVADTTNLGRQTASTSGVTDTTKWYYFVGTYDGAFIRIYRDGALAQEVAAAGGALLASTSNAVIGGAPTSGSTPNPRTKAFIDEVAIYNRVLSATEIADHYAKGTT